MHILGIGDASVRHGRAHPGGDLLDHGGTADVFGQDLGADGRAYGQARLGRIAGDGGAGEQVDVRGDHSVATAGPDHGHGVDLGRGARTRRDQSPAIGLVGQDAAEVVDPAIALGLADHRHDVVGAHPA